MSTSKNLDAISDLMTSNIYIKEVKIDGSPLAQPDTFHHFGSVRDMEVLDEPTDKVEKDEAGYVVHVTEEDREPVLKGLAFQSDKTVLDVLSTPNKYYAVYFDLGIVNGKYQELFVPLARFKRSVSLKAPKRPPFEIHIMKNPAEITIAAADGMPEGHHTAADCVIAKDAYYKIVETAVA